jgi:hypothetical protein
VVLCSFSLPAQRKRTKRKGTFSKVFFYCVKNRKNFSKIAPRLHDFLTKSFYYTDEKDFFYAVLSVRLLDSETEN